MSKLGRAFQLMSDSWTVLASHPQLILFPVFSTLSALIVTLSFLAPLFRFGVADHVMATRQVEPSTWVWLFVCYYLNYLVIVFFNAALIACVDVKFRGGEPSIGEGIRLALARLDRIMAWALAAACVSLIIRNIEERSERLGRLIASLVGTAWTLVTYLIVPVLVFEDLGPIDAVSRSAALFRKTWGEQLSSGLGLSVLYFLLALPGLAIVMVSRGRIPALLLAAVYLLLVAAVGAAVKGIFTAALYR